MTSKAEGDRKGPLPSQPNPRPYYDYARDLPGNVPITFIVGAGEEWTKGGDPCGRPRTYKYSRSQYEL